MKILIADDEESLRISLEMILKRASHDHEIHFAIDGEEAVTKSKDTQYDLILLDLNMPKLDGYEALKQIREIHAKIPIVFVTATGEPKKVMQSISQHSLTGFIEKPFSPDQVMEVVNRAAKSAA